MTETTITTFFHRGWTNFSGQFNATSIDMRFNFLEGQRTTSPSRNAILAFTSLLLYYILSEAKLRFSSPTYANIADHGITFFGFLSLASLASILFPDSVIPVLYAAFIMLSAGSDIYLLMAEASRTTFLHRGWTSFSGQFNAASIDMRFNLTEGQYTSPSRHAILAFIVPIIINLMQLKFQGKDKTPFETHPKTMGFVIISLLLYSVLSEAKLRLSSPTYATIVHHGMGLFGFLSLASLASTLFPDSVMPVLYVVFITLSAGGLLHFFCWTVNGQPVQSRLPVRPMLRCLTDSHRVRAHAFMNERDTLPV